MKNFQTLLIVLVLSSLYPQASLSDYIFTAPPRESLEKGKKVYEPISDYLTKVTGERFIYEHPENWSEYSSKMHAEHYDLNFDGPHFVDWRINNINHAVLIKLPQLFRWQLITRKDDTTITSIKDMIGKNVCAPGSPNFGMLSMFSHFPDPDKQPQHVKIKGWINVYEAVVAGKCDVGVLPKTNLATYDKHGEHTKIIHTHLPYPNQGISAGARISPKLRETIRTALLSSEGQDALTNLRNRYGAGAAMIRADDEEYDGVRFVLRRADNFEFEKDKNIPLVSNK